MNSPILDNIPNLVPFNYDTHFDALFIGKEWILVNGLNKKKSVYIFEDDHTLNIAESETTSTTSWTVDVTNTFTIETTDGLITVKAYFKDDDVLVLKHLNKSDFALFINKNNYEDEINSIVDVRKFLRNKYKQKVTKLIYGHEFYYIAKSREFGPFTVEELAEKVKHDAISAYCFVRDINEDDYSKRLRIWDLIKELD